MRNEVGDKVLNIADETVDELELSDLWNDILDILDDGLDVKLDDGLDILVDVDTGNAVDGLVCGWISMASQAARMCLNILMVPVDERTLSRRPETMLVTPSSC